MYKAYYSHLENAYEEDNDSLSSSFWTDQESEDQGECYVKDDQIETELGIYKQDINKAEEGYVKGGGVNEQAGEKPEEGDECQNEEEKRCYVKEQSKDEDLGRLRGEQVSQRGASSATNPGKENDEGKEKSRKSGAEDEGSENNVKEGCPGEEMSGSEFGEAGNEDKGVEENNEEEQRECFVGDENVDGSLEESESESHDLESEEEIEYFAGGFSQGDDPEGEELWGDEERKTFFVHQDNMSELVMNDDQTYKEEQYPETRPSHNKNALLVNVDNTDEAEWTDQIYTKHRENDGSAEQIWTYSADPRENGVYDEDYHGSISSLTASVLTSGYGTYQPDSPKDDLDVRDDCSLFELELHTEYPRALHTQDDPNLSWYRDGLSSEVAEKQIPSETRNGVDWTLFESFIDGDSTMYDYPTTTVRGTSDENRLRSATVCPEESQSVDLPASEERASDSVHLQVTRTNTQSVTFCSEDVETFHMCNNAAFNRRRNEYTTAIKDHRSEDGHAGQNFRKTKQGTSRPFRRG